MEIGTAKSVCFSLINYGEQKECTLLFDNVIQFMVKAVSNSKLHAHFSWGIVL
jgi:hypothetical protein